MTNIIEITNTVTNFVEIEKTNIIISNHIITNTLDKIDIMNIPTDGWAIFGAVATVLSALFTGATAYIMLQANKTSAQSVEEMKRQNKISDQSVEEMKKQSSMQTINSLKEQYEKTGEKLLTSKKIANGTPFVVGHWDLLQILNQVCFLLVHKHINEKYAKYIFRWYLIYQVSLMVSYDKDYVPISEYNSVARIFIKWTNKYKPITQDQHTTYQEIQQIREYFIQELGHHKWIINK